MAFTAQLTEPSPVSGSLATRGSTTGAVGGALSGLADILDVGLKASNEARAKKVGNQLETTLASEAATYASPTASESLIGEGTNPRELVGAQFNHNMDRMAQAVAQNPQRREEFLSRVSAETQKAIAANPRFADVIRKRAQDVLGFSPTAEMLVQKSKDEEDAKSIREAVVKDAVQWASKSGHLSVTPDGQLDIPTMVAAAQAGQRAEYDLKLEHERYEILSQKNTLNKGTPLTDAQIQSGKAQRFTEIFSPSFNQLINGLHSQLEFALNSGSKADDAKFRAQTIQSLNSAKTQWLGWMNGTMNTAASSPDGLDPKVHAEVQAMYEKMFEPYEKSLTGDLATTNVLLNYKKQLEAIGAIEARNIFPLLTQVNDAFPGAGPALAQIMLNVVPGSANIRTALEQEVMKGMHPATPTDFLRDTASIGNGKATVTDLPSPERQRAAIKGLETVVEHYSNQPVLEPFQLLPLGNSLNALATAGLTQNSADSLWAAAQKINSPSTLAAFDAFARTSPGGAEIVGKNMLGLLQKSAQANMKALQEEIVSTGSYSGFAKTGRSTPSNTTFTPVYNASTGQVELKQSGGSANSLPATPSTKLIDRVKDINKSLAGIVHLKDYGTDDFASTDEIQLKKLLAETAGMQIENDFTEPTTASGKSSSAKTEKKQEVTEDMGIINPRAQADVESRNNPNAKSGVGALGRMQVMPATAGNPGHGIEPAKDFSDAELTRVGTQLQDALEKKYGNPWYAAAAYNWGEGHVDKWIKAGADWSKLPTETQLYIGRIAVANQKFMDGGFHTVEVVD